MLIPGNYANAHHNYKQEFLPVIEVVPDQLKVEIDSKVEDASYYSQDNINKCLE